MKSLLFTLLSFYSFTLLGQEWVDLMQDHSVNFYDVKEAFNEEWEGREYERGKGWKQYKRWEYFMEQRTYPSGERISGELLYNELKNALRESNSLEKTDNTWEPVGPTQWSSQGWNPGLGRVNAVVEDPNDVNTIYVATPSGGLWKSTDSGSSWTPLTDNLPAIGASGLAIDPNDSNILYLATGDGNGNDTYSIGVMKSIDGGDNWEPTGLTFQVDQGVRCSKILMDPSNSQRLWVATHQGLFTTSNGGESWSQTIDDLVRDIEVKPSDPSVVYVCGDRFYKSENSGESFSQITNGVPSAGAVNRLTIAVTEANSDYIYMLASSQENSGFYGLYRSVNEGEDFNLMSDSPNILTYSEIGDGEGGQGWYDLALAASPENENEIYAGGINVWKSSDGGSTWEIKSHWVHPSNIGYTHADIHTLEFYGNTLYCGSDGGVFKYIENIDSWQDLSEGLQISQYYRIAVSTTNPELILAASQDNGTNRFDENGNYVHLLGGDGNGAAIDYTNDDIMYSAYPGGSFQRSTNGGNSFQGFTSGVTESGAWVTPLELHPQTPSTLFAGYENVWKNTNGTWFPISNLPTSGTLRSLKVANSDPDVIYAGGQGYIYRTINGGENWTSVTGNLPNLTITGIEVDPDDPLRVWVTCSGYQNGNKVFFSETGGSPWTNISQNLPNVPANCITYQVGTDDGLYIGTDIGVYFKDAESISWTYYHEGLPNVIVNQIILQYNAQKGYYWYIR